MSHKRDIPVTHSSMPPLDEYIEEIAPLWESHWLTNNGAIHQKLESQLEAELEVGNVSLFANGHLALECVLEAMELKGKIITTPFTFISTANAIVRAGLTPVFADIKRDDFTLDPESVERLIDSDTCAIVPVHVYGNLCDTEALQDIADRYGLKLIYDAAHAFGVKRNGVSAATFGHASMFSFHATKVFNTIEGGALCSNDPGLKTRLEQMKNFGITNQESAAYIGGNAKMHEFSAAMGICNLRHLDEEIGKRKAVFERYVENLSDVTGIRLCIPDDGLAHNYAYAPILFEDGFGATRDEVFDELEMNGIKARKYFYPLVTDFECYQASYDSSQTPVAKDVAERVLTLPMYADLPLEEVDRISMTILGCVRP